MCESQGGHPGLPVPNSPYCLCGRKATLNWLACVSIFKHFCGSLSGTRWILRGPTEQTDRRAKQLIQMASARKIRTVEDLETLPVVIKPRTLSRAPSIAWSRKVPKRSATKRRDVFRAIVIQISTATVSKATMRTAQQTWWSASRLSPALRYQLETKIAVYSMLNQPAKHQVVCKVAVYSKLNQPAKHQLVGLRKTPV